MKSKCVKKGRDLKLHEIEINGIWIQTPKAQTPNMLNTRFYLTRPFPHETVPGLYLDFSDSNFFTFKTFSPPTSKMTISFSYRINKLSDAWLSLFSWCFLFLLLSMLFEHLSFLSFWTVPGPLLIYSFLSKLLIDSCISFYGHF